MDEHERYDRHEIERPPESEDPGLSPAMRPVGCLGGRTPEDVITVHVKGLSCPFCVLGIEKRLKAISSVGKVNSDWGKGELYVKVKSGKSVTDDELRDAIKRAGFTSGKIERPVAPDKADSK